MKHLYFAYGANTNLDNMSYRCPNADVLGPAQIFGYRLVFRGCADIEMDENGEVNGVLWLISDDDLESLDQFEGFPHYYLRQRVWINYNDELQKYLYTDPAIVLTEINQYQLYIYRILINYSYSIVSSSGSNVNINNRGIYISINK
mgnify:CR=1 FL=1